MLLLYMVQCSIHFLYFPSFHAHFSRGEYTAVVELPEGSHEYKFVVDGQWYHKSDEVRLSTVDSVG